MSVNIYDGTNLIPIAGKTVPAPTPDYVDEQYNNATTYSKGMTCISGNKRYRYINSTASSGHQPPNATYWEELSVADEIKNECVLLHSNKITTGATSQTNTITNLNIDISQYKEIMLVVGVSENNIMYYFRGTQVYPVSLLGISSGNTTVRCDPNDGTDYRFNSYIYISNAKKITYSSITAYYGGSTLDVELRVYGIK